jgi:NDP-4-keto-2,6-dideoxyhexose 3-C-methyltransferase
MEATRTGLVTGVAYREHDHCRVCTGQLDSVLDLGAQPLSDFNRKEPDWRFAPLELTRCRLCGLVQNRHTVDRDELFRDYWYKSGISETMRAALADLAEAVTIYAKLQEGDTLLDIGSNDGTFFRFFTDNIRRVGFEPSNIDGDVVNNGVLFREYFNQNKWFTYFGEGVKAKAINCSAVFYSAEDPVRFIRDVAAILAEDGVFVLQMNDLTAMVQQTAFDTIGHEHTCCWSLMALNPLLMRFGLEAFRVERNIVNGGSVRLFIGHKGKHPIQSNVKEQVDAEVGLDVRSFGLQVVQLCNELHDMVARVSKTKRVYIYGASTRGTTILHAADLDERFITGAAERDPNKHGFLVPGTNIPIVSEDDAREQADLFLALPYHFKEQFLNRELEWMQKGGEFIFPLPEVRRIGTGCKSR